MRYGGGDWTQLYAEDFTNAEKDTILKALGSAFDQSGFRPEKYWGPLIEDRGSQITLSALGQDAPLEEKVKWDPDFAKRKKIKAILDPALQGFSISLGGATSIDITRPGVDRPTASASSRPNSRSTSQKCSFLGTPCSLAATTTPRAPRASSASRSETRRKRST